MAGGVSRHYEHRWVYHPGGTTFEDRVGAILSKGVNLQESFRQQAMHTAKKAIEFENEQRKGDLSATTSQLNQTNSKSSTPPVDTRGFVWVTEKGETIGPAYDTSATNAPVPPPDPKAGLTTERQLAMASMNATQRSVHMWRRVNPGCMEISVGFPQTTHKTHFTGEPLLEPLNKERFRMKTDFTAYADQSIRSGPGRK